MLKSAIGIEQHIKTNVSHVFLLCRLPQGLKAARVENTGPVSAEDLPT